MYGFEDLPGSNNLTLTNGTGTLDTVGKVEGAAQLQIAANGVSTAPIATKTGTGVFTGDPNDMGVIALLVDYGDDAEFQSCTGVDKRFGRSGSYVTTSGITVNSVNESNLGRRWETFHVSEASNIVALGSGQFDFRAQLSHVAPYCETVKVDALVRQAAGRPSLILAIDDARVDLVRANDGFLALAAQHCPPLAKHIIAFPPMALLGDTATRMTGSDLQYAKQMGCNIGLNLTPDDLSLTSYATMAAVMSAYTSQFAMLAALGLDGPDMYDTCASNGSLRTPGTKVQKSSVTTDGSSTVLMADTSGIVVGMKAAGAKEMARDRTVVTVNDNVSVVLSGTVPAGITFMSFTDVSGEHHTGKLAPAAQAAGVRSIRQTNSGLIPTRGGIGSRRWAMPALSLSSATAASIIAQVELAILRGCTLYIYGHLLDELLSSGLAMKVSEFIILLQYLYAKYLSGDLVFVTPRELGERDGWDISWPLAA